MTLTREQFDALNTVLAEGRTAVAYRYADVRADGLHCPAALGGWTPKLEHACGIMLGFLCDVRVVEPGARDETQR